METICSFFPSLCNKHSSVHTTAEPDATASWKPGWGRRAARDSSGKAKENGEMPVFCRPSEFFKGVYIAIVVLKKVPESTVQAS